MGNYRHADILAEETFTSTGTKEIPIDISKPISRIYIRGRATNPATRATIIAHPSALMSKIELVSGSDVLYSLSAKEGQALNHYELNQTPDSEISDGGDELPHATVLIHFGRWLWDRELALDPVRFKDLKLKITHNYLAYCASSTNFKLLVKADCFDERAIAPIGFLQAKTYGTETLSGATHKYIYPPMDLPYRRLCLEAYLTNSAVNSQVGVVKIDEDTDSRKIIEEDLDEYLRRKMAEWTPMLEHFALRVQTTATSMYVMPTYWPNVMGVWAQHQYAVGRLTYTEAERQALYSATNGSYPYMGFAYGYVPHHVVDYPLGDPKDISDWYDPSKLKKLRVDVLGKASSTAALTLFGQQLRRY